MATGGRPDSFRGSERLLHLSQRLMDWYEEPVSDQDIVEALGATILPAFRFAQERLQGKVRKVTLESAFCHSADIAFRAAALGLPDGVIQAALLHDVVEDTSKTLAQAAVVLDEIAATFGAEVATTVSLLTNRFSIAFAAVAQKVRPDMPFAPESGRAFQAALEVLRWELPPALRERFAHEIASLARFLADEADFTYGAHIVKRDRKFTLAVALDRLVYRAYIQDLVRTAAEDGHRAPSGPAVAALVIKLLDAVDNIRTSEVSNRLSLFKLVNKSEYLADALGKHLRETPVPKEGLAACIGPLARLVELRLVDQLDVRRRAVAENFSETRFAGLVIFLAEHTERLRCKYDVPAARDERIDELEEEVRSLSLAARGRSK